MADPIVSRHPPGIVIQIVGTEMGSNGWSCEEHTVCGSILEEDMVVRLRKVQVVVEGREETAIACYWVSDGVDRCRVGFLMRHMVAHAKRYDGALAQVTRVFSGDVEECSSREERRLFHAKRGCCDATIISSLSPGGRSKHSSLKEKEVEAMVTEDLEEEKWTNVLKKNADKRDDEGMMEKNMEVKKRKVNGDDKMNDNK